LVKFVCRYICVFAGTLSVLEPPLPQVPEFQPWKKQVRQGPVGRRIAGQRVGGEAACIGLRDSTLKRLSARHDVEEQKGQSLCRRAELQPRQGNLQLARQLLQQQRQSFVNFEYATQCCMQTE